MNLRKVTVSPQLYIVIILTLIYWWGVNTITPFLSLFAENINLSIFQTSIFLGGVAVARIFIQPLVGLLIGNIKENHSIIAAFLLLTISSLGYAMFDNFTVLILLRFFEGIAMGLFIIATRMLINNNFIFNEISLINNYSSGVKNLGTFMGPALAGLFIEKIGMQAIFYISALVFFVGLILATKIKIMRVDKLENHTEKLKGTVFSKKNLFLMGLMIVHSIEFIGLGLWLAGWPIYASNVLDWHAAKIGLSFSIMAISGFAIVPIIGNKFNKLDKQKIIIGLLMLAISPILVIYGKNNEILIWVGLSLCGIGATIYFSSFHTYTATLLSKRDVPIFYGLIGTFTFAGQAIGFTLAPILWKKFSFDSPILLDCIVLFCAVLLYIVLFFIPYSFATKNELSDVSVKN